MKTPIVIKVGGRFFKDLEKASAENSDSSIDAQINIQNNTASALLSSIAGMQSKGSPVILVHGGGDQVLERMQQLGIESIKREGLRVSPDEHMPIVSGVLAGELNKKLVATSATYGISAVGLSLADGDSVICHEHPNNIGAVGIPEPNDERLLSSILNLNMTPMIASIGRDQNARLYNVNADHAAICIAKLLKAQLYFLADVPGVLDKNGEVIKQLNEDTINTLIQDGTIKDGMTVKVNAAMAASKETGQTVTIASWNDAYELLVNRENKGSMISPNIQHTQSVKDS